MLFEDMKLVVPGKGRKANPMVEKAIAEIQANNEKVTLAKISKLSGVAYMTLYMSGKYDQYVNKQKKVAPAPVVVVEEQKEPLLVFHEEGSIWTTHIRPTKEHFCILVEQTNEVHNVIGTNELDAKIEELLQDRDVTLKINKFMEIITATRKTTRTKK